MSFLGLVVVLEVTMLLDGVQYCRYMHEKVFLSTILVPHRKVEGRILLQRSLDLEVSQSGNFFLDLVFLGNVVDRRWLT